MFANIKEIIICKTIKNFTAINKYCFKWDYNPFQKKPPKVFYKKAVLKNFAIFTGKRLCWSLFLIKLQDSSPAFLLKRDSNTGLFLWILRNFKEHLFWRTSANRYFCLFQVNSLKHLKKIHSKSKVIEQIWKYFAPWTSYEKKSLKCAIWIFMFSCANLHYRHAQTNSYRVLNSRSVKITDMKSDPMWISYHFVTYKHFDKLDQKAIWLFSVTYRSIFISGFM